MIARLLLLTLLATIAVQQVSVSSTNAHISQTATYSVTVIITSISNFATTSTIQIQLPSPFYDSSNIAGATCIPTCTKVGSTLVLNANSFTLPLVSQVVNLVINNIVNPAFSGFPEFGYTILGTTNNILE